MSRLKMDIFGGNCPIWADVELIPKTIQVSSYQRQVEMENAIGMNRTDWRIDIFVNYEYETRCQIYFMICFCSCIFGVTWLVFFFMCGKGGYDISIFIAPWRIVPIALLFNFFLMTVTMYAVQDLEKGYLKFCIEIESFFYQITGTSRPTLPGRNCAVVQAYVEIYNQNNYDVCKTFLILEILSWMMTWSWSGGFVTLFFRVITVNDFRLLKIMIYEAPQDTSEIQEDEFNEEEKRESLKRHRKDHIDLNYQKNLEE